MSPGWYGKIPALGDFASRRLPPAFVAGLDTWLQEALRHAQERLGSGWLDAFLTSHIWRFCLFAGVHGEENWLGIVMPSVDRVGRYFPLTVAASGDLRLLLGLLDGSATAWLNDVEHAARGTLDINATIEDFEAALAVAPVPWESVDSLAGDRAMTSGGSWIFSRDGHIRSVPTDESSLIAHFATVATIQHLRGQGLWWTSSSDDQCIAYFIAEGWPSPEAFVQMITERSATSQAGTPRADAS